MEQVIEIQVNSGSIFKVIDNYQYVFSTICEKIKVNGVG